MLVGVGIISRIQVKAVLRLHLLVVSFIFVTNGIEIKVLFCKKNGLLMDLQMLWNVTLGHLACMASGEH